VVSADCIVIGGGVMGCAAALRLAQAGVATTVLERAIPGAEASSAAAGILAAQEELATPGPLFELAVASRGCFAALAAELQAATGIDIGYRPRGVLSLVDDERALARLAGRYAWQRELGLPVEVMARAQLLELEPGLAATWQGGVYFAEDHQLDPRPYIRALAQAAAQAGARFITGRPVEGVTSAAGQVTGVELDSGHLAARHVVIAAGAWSTSIEGLGLPPPAAVRPIKGQIAQLGSSPAAVRGTIVLPGGYLVGRADGRVLVGSTMEPVGFERHVTAGGLAHVLGLALRAVPALASAPVLETWANFRPTTADELPLLGPGPLGGLVLATGHFRHGILLSPITAELVRDLVVNGRCERELAPFSWRRLVA
jgi:glycine oxidase